MPDPHYVCILVEGPTERGVLSGLLTEHLAQRNIHLFIESIEGAVSKARVVSNAKRMIKQRPTATLTTFFDYYGAQNRWVEIGAQNQPVTTLALRVEAALHSWVSMSFSDGGALPRFVPYVQMYELEALFFSQPTVLAEAFADPEKAPVVQQHRDDCPHTCEDINNSPQTAPSKRIETIFGRYKKGNGQRSQARAFAEKADLATIRAACPRFDAWVRMLENLPALPPAPSV